MGSMTNAIAEGVSIACAAARTSVRNHILVETIARGEDFDPARVAGFAAETLRALADEQDSASKLVRGYRRRTFGKFTDSDGTHDYRDRDGRNLRHRRRQYAGVASKLRKMAEEPDAVRALVAQARDAAWGDVESNLHRRLHVEGMRAESDPDYDRMRGARMQALRLVDLPRLAAHRGVHDALDTPAISEVAGVDEITPGTDSPASSA